MIGGQRVHFVWDSEMTPTPKATESLQKIMMNLWPGTGVDSWLNAFTYPGVPLYAEYDWVSFTPGECPY